MRMPSFFNSRLTSRPSPVPRLQTRKSRKQKQDESMTAWGKEVGGLQAGLTLRPGEKRLFHHGEVITLVVRVRNVGKEEIKFQYLKEFFVENRPIEIDTGGETVPQPRLLVTRLKHIPAEVSLAPGKDIELASARYEARATEWDAPAIVRSLCENGSGQRSIQAAVWQHFGGANQGGPRPSPARHRETGTRNQVRSARRTREEMNSPTSRYRPAASARQRTGGRRFAG
jgi:hypothetical protein